MYTTTFVETPLSDLLTRVQTLKHDGIRFVQMCAEKDSQDNIDLLYTFYDETMENALNLVVPLKPGDKVPSIQEMYFAAFSYENETHDLYGVRFINMKLDFGGHFFNLAAESPMTIISPEQRAAREKAAKLKAAQEAKAAKAAAAAREAAEGRERRARAEHVCGPGGCRCSDRRERRRACRGVWRAARYRARRRPGIARGPCREDGGKARRYGSRESREDSRRACGQGR